MEKFEYLARMFNVRTKDKDYENYVVNAIYNRVGNPELVPVTQQFVRSNNDPRVYYLLDLYFPQLNYGIEVDEEQHLLTDNKESDIIREQDIRNAIECEVGRIEIFEQDNLSNKARMRSFEDIDVQINGEVQKIQEMIKKKIASGCELKWQTNEDLKDIVIQVGEYNIKDNVDYKGITEIYNISGHKAKRLGKCFWSLNEKYYLWVPTLAIDLGNGQVKSSNNYENHLNENHSIIIEYDKNHTRFNSNDTEWDGTKKRVVFMKMRDMFGKNCIKFIGVFKAKGVNSDGGRIYEREVDYVKIADLK